MPKQQEGLANNPNNTSNPEELRDANRAHGRMTNEARIRVGITERIAELDQLIAEKQALIDKKKARIAELRAKANGDTISSAPDTVSSGVLGNSTADFGASPNLANPDTTDSDSAASNAASSDAAPQHESSASSAADHNPDSTPDGHDSDSDVLPGQTSEVVPSRQETINKAKKNRRLKQSLAAAALAAVMVATTFLGIHFGGQNKNTEQVNASLDRSGTVATETVDTGHTDDDSDITSLIGENREAIGIIDGYGEYGMWLSKHKSSNYAFACATEVAEVCGGNPKEMLKYAAKNQVGSFADYLSAIPDVLQSAEYRGLSMEACEDKLESLSPEDFDAERANFNSIIDSAAGTRPVVLNGYYQNAFMRLKDADGKVNHENMELVSYTGHENGFRATEFFWCDEDGHEIGSMIVKIQQDAQGNIIGGCMQVVERQEGSSHRLSGLPVIKPGSLPVNPTPDTPVITPDSTPDPTPVDPVPETPDPTPVDPVPETPDPTPVDPIPETPDPKKPNPTPPSTPDPTPNPETPAPKDEENLIRIDEQINEDIAEDIGTDEVVVTPDPGVSSEDITERPTSDSYQGTEPTIVTNESSQDAESVQPTEPENNYSNNNGGAHQSEYAPVQENSAAQAAADTNETPASEAPTSGQDLTDSLADLGIN